MLKSFALQEITHINRAKERKRFSYYYQQVQKNNTFMYAGTLLQRAARLFKSTTALICQDTAISYKELYKQAVGVSIYLQQKGIKPGDRVALLYENSIAFYVAYYGIWQTGAVIAPLNSLLHEEELHHILKDATPKALLISDQLYKNFDFSSFQDVIIIQQNELNNAEINDEQQITSYTIPDCDPEAMAALLYTSGTTGLPKGVMLSSRNILTNIVQGIAHIDVSNNDRVLAALPLFHSFAQFGCVWASCFVGATVIVIPRIDRKMLKEGIEKKPTLVAGVPALYGLFALMKTLSFSSVRYFVSGGDALPDKIRMGFELIYRRRLCNGYGLTETSPLISVNFDDLILASNTIGRPAQKINCSLRNEEGNEVQPGQKGILWVKGDNVMLGYYNKPELTQEVLQDGWFNTGDWAYFDTAGRMVIAGRHKDLIIHKGINIYPQEIENILLSHEQVVHAGVIGKKDADVGEIPIAFVGVRSAEKNLDSVLKELCKQYLASYKVPRKIYVLALNEIPLTSLQKVDKKELRERYLNNE